MTELPGYRLAPELTVHSPVHFTARLQLWLLADHRGPVPSLCQDSILQGKSGERSLILETWVD